MDSRFWLWWCLLAIGCVRNEYTVELIESDGQVERKLTINRPSNASREDVREDADRIAKAYGAVAPEPDVKQAFQGRFTGKLPDDIGNFGVYHTWDTPLGSMTIYGERLRGDIDAADELKGIESAANRITDLLLEWLEQELRHDEHWPDLQNFLDTQIRRDLHNIGIYIWASPIADRSDAARLQARVLLYLAERDYFSVEELPELHRILQVDDEERLFAFWKARLAARLNGNADWWPDFTTEKFGASLESFLKATEEYANLVEEAVQADLDVGDIDADDVALALAAKLVGASSLMGDYDSLKLSLKSTGIAVITNGEKLETESEVSWSIERLPSTTNIPSLAYAVVAKPNQRFQERHFGEAVLSGKGLVDYCLWYHGLTDDERREWDAFIDQRHPGPELRQELSAFRFSREPENLPMDQRFAYPIIEAIRNGLRD